MRNNLIFIYLMFAFHFALLFGCDVDVDWPEQNTSCAVTGQVKLDGRAISDVKLVFVPQRVGKKGDRNRIASGLSNDRGEFVLEIDSRKPKEIRHGRYRVIVSKVVEGEELFHKSYNVESVLMVEINSQESIQRPELDLLSSGTY